MNILPKKRWHVRTKENIARVRKDEAEAAEKERQEQIRIENADREARLNILKLKSKQHLLEQGVEVKENESSVQIPEHINLFADLEHAVQTTNKDHDKEVKDKQEEYEKKIGYLTYLGQDTNESLKKKNWYEVHPESSRFSRSSDIKDTYEKLVLRDEDGKPKCKEIEEKYGEVSWKSKQTLDPINAFKKYCFGKHKSPTTPSNELKQASSEPKYKEKRIKKKDKKKAKKTSKHEKINKKLQQLREARLKREQEEKQKTELFLKGLHGTSSKDTTENEVSRVKPKYNSQFNPELARQNYR